ncbi:MAG: Holliday junction branch migration protein RuvA [Clostridia bacterium]|nr:Holliday junction branch migration protein RuvA [Clostridia bacterium]
MIAYVRGRVLTTTAETVILDVHGIGYEIYCSGAVFKKIVVGEAAEIFTYLQVKEDGVTLFGFESVKEKEIFLKLTSVSGVGPKLGIAVLTGLSADEFATAIATADVKKLSAVKGLGKKTAEKIVLELHGKISAAEVMEASGEPKAAETAEPKTKLSAMEEEGVSALMGLGFTKAESIQAVKKAMETGVKTVEELIMRALQGGV